MGNNVMVGIALALAAAIAVIVGFVLVDDDTPSQPTETANTADSRAETTTVQSTTDPPTPPQVLVAESYLDALNLGDDAAALDLLSGSASAVFNANAKLRRVLSHANERHELIEPCQVVEADDESDTESLVACGIHYTNDWNGPAGFYSDIVVTFTITADGTISSVSIPRQIEDDAFFSYIRAFWDWLGETHPDVHSEIYRGNRDALPGWIQNTGDMAVAVQYVEEFIAQSDVYPLDGAAG